MNEQINKYCDEMSHHIPIHVKNNKGWSLLLFKLSILVVLLSVKMRKTTATFKDCFQVKHFYYLENKRVRKVSKGAKYQINHKRHQQ